MSKAKDYECPECGLDYVSQESKPICPDCTQKQGKKIYLEES